MEEDYVAAQEREKRAKSKTSRRETWMNGKWKTSSNGNPRLYRNGFVIVVSFRYGRWGYWIKERKGEQSWSKSGFASEKKAKLAAFECFDELRN